MNPTMKNIRMKPVTVLRWRVFPLNLRGFFEGAYIINHHNHQSSQLNKQQKVTNISLYKEASCIIIIGPHNERYPANY